MLLLFYWNIKVCVRSSPPAGIQTQVCGMWTPSGLFGLRSSSCRRALAVFSQHTAPPKWQDKIRPKPNAVWAAAAFLPVTGHLSGGDKKMLMKSFNHTFEDFSVWAIRTIGIRNSMKLNFLFRLLKLCVIYTWSLSTHILQAQLLFIKTVL